MNLLDFIDGGHSKTLNVSGGCHNCPRKRIDFVPPTLKGGPLLWLGETPSVTEVERQEAGVGSSAELLRATAAEVGMPVPWSFTNTVHCRAPEGAAPSPKEVSACLSQFTLDEIKHYPIVALMGNTPLTALFPRARGDHMRGNLAHHPDFPDTRFFSMYHPAYITRNPHVKPEFQQQMERLSRIVRGEAPPNWKIVRGAPAVEALRAMCQMPLLSIDFETSSLHSWEAGTYVKSVAVTWDEVTVVTALREDPVFPALMGLLKEFLSDSGKSALGANIAFDLEWMEREYGFRVACQLLHDTAVQWYHAGQYQMASLKELVARELDGYRFLVHEPHLCKDMELLLCYNAEDVIYPLRLMRKAMTILKPKTRDLAARVVAPAALVLRRIQSAGFYVRQDYRQQKIEEYAEKRRTVIDAWRATDPEFVPTTYESGKGLLHYLFNMRKLPVLQYTESGEEPSTDKSVLKQYVRDGYAFVQHLLDMREIDKIESTYLTAYDKFLWQDSRVRSGYTITYTDSGRSSSRQPNLQNIPRKKEIRDLFGVPDGHVLLESDLSQAEFRIMVCLAQDENGINGYLRGDDAHTITARKIAGVDVPTKEQRTLAKPVNFGFLYGAQATMVQTYAADEYGVIWTLEQAESFRRVFFETYPRFPDFHTFSKNRLIFNKGWFESVVGHTFHYEQWDSRNEGKRDHEFRAALNSEAQGPAAHITFYIMVLARQLLDAHGMRSVEFVNTVHDSILTEIPNPKWVPDVVACIEDARAAAYEWVKHWFVVPLVVDHKIGQSWGTMTDYHLNR